MSHMLAGGAVPLVFRVVAMRAEEDGHLLSIASARWTRVITNLSV